MYAIRIQFTLSQLYAFTSMGVVVVSTVVFILSTMPELTDDIDLILDFNFNKSSKAASPDNPAVERWEDVSWNFKIKAKALFYSTWFIMYFNSIKS